MKRQDIRTASRTAHLNATEGRSDTAGWTIHGTAIGADEVTHGAVDGDPQRVEWSGDVLQAAAGTLDGQPVIDVHSDGGDGAIEYPPPADITVGKVERVGFDADMGVLYEATLADAELAQKIEADMLTVSPELRFDATERDDGVLEATAAEFAALAVVSVGGSDAASAAAGPNEAMASLSKAGLEALLSSAPDAPDTDGTEGATEGTHASERMEEIDAKLSSSFHSLLPDDYVAELQAEACDLAGVEEYDAALEAYGLAEPEPDPEADAVTDIHGRLSMMGEMMPDDYVADLKAEACEAAGTETFEAALEERGLSKIEDIS